MGECEMSHGFIGQQRVKNNTVTTKRPTIDPKTGKVRAGGVPGMRDKAATSRAKTEKQGGRVNGVATITNAQQIMNDAGRLIWHHGHWSIKVYDRAREYRDGHYTGNWITGAIDIIKGDVRDTHRVKQAASGKGKTTQKRWRLSDTGRVEGDTVPQFVLDAARLYMNGRKDGSK